MGVLNSFEDYEIAESFNRETTLDDNTKLLIVGTLTPPKGKGKYFYSTRKTIYECIDKALNNDNKLIILKNKFKNYNDSNSNKDEVDLNNEIVRNKIKEHLQQNKIAFLDVVKYAVRNKRSSDDKDIMVAELDYDAFKDLKNVKTVIVNSEAAKDAFDKIIQKNKSEGKEYRYSEKIYLSQIRRGFNEEEWVNTIKEALDIQS